jgi:sec-independent protein translocase protein TatA
MIGEWEIILILAVVLILFGARKLPDLARGLMRGMGEFGRAADREAHDAGESLGGIYGKPAAQALTPDNHVAELYDPGVLQNGGEDDRRAKGSWFPTWKRLLRRIVSFLLGRVYLTTDETRRLNSCPLVSIRRFFFLSFPPLIISPARRGCGWSHPSDRRGGSNRARASAAFRA